jgi:HTH-type transcriptional regulator / antitoxin HigA
MHLIAIESEAEYHRVLGIVELLMNKANTSTEEDRLLDLFVILIEKFESQHYPSQNLSTPHSRLLHLMAENNLQPTDLIPVLGSSNLTAEIIAGKRAIDPTQAERLSERFNLPAALFLV